jgi:putative two-component system response regulator
MRRHHRFQPWLDDRQVELLTQAAPLHDLGLLAVPTQLLDKPGPLDADERALMERHAEVGDDALARAAQDTFDALDWLPVARQIARHHHERWDGAGYPDRLAGDTIPWPARLLALVDSYDGLTSARPHRPALSHVAASAVIVAERGAQFDPDVVDAFLECADEWPAMALRHG